MPKHTSCDTFWSWFLQAPVDQHMVEAGNHIKDGCGCPRNPTLQETLRT